MITGGGGGGHPIAIAGFAAVLACKRRAERPAGLSTPAQRLCAGRGGGAPCWRSWNTRRRGAEIWGEFLGLGSPPTYHQTAMPLG